MNETALFDRLDRIAFALEAIAENTKKPEVVTVVNVKGEVTANVAQEIKRKFRPGCFA